MVNEPAGIVQYSDGSWAAIGNDGWPIDLDELAELAAPDVIDVEPISVRDSAIQPRALPGRTS